MAIEMKAQSGERNINNPEGKTEESNKEQLKRILYGGIYPFWCSTIFVEKLRNILWGMGLRTVVIQSKEAIDAFLTEEEAGDIIRRLK